MQQMDDEAKIKQKAPLDNPHNDDVVHQLKQADLELLLSELIQKRREQELDVVDQFLKRIMGDLEKKLDDMFTDDDRFVVNRKNYIQILKEHYEECAQNYKHEA